MSVSGANAKSVDEVAMMIETLPATELRNRFPHEANCHRAMIARRKKGAVVHPEFREFRSFLRHMGPMPAIGATVDRIDPADPEYAPGKVRWADKHTQANNKLDTIILHQSSTGQSFTASQLAKRQSVSPDTIRKRRGRGWTDDEIIAGAKSKVVSPAPPKAPRPLKASLADVLRRCPPTDEQLEKIEAYLARGRSDSAATEAARRLRAEIAQFEADRANYAPGEGEPLPAVFEELREELSEQFGAEMASPGGCEELRRRVDAHWQRSWFGKYKKFPVRYDRLSEVQLATLRRVDPEWVAEQEARLAVSQEVGALL
jgi:hypothetical protein